MTSTTVGYFVPNGYYSLRIAHYYLLADYRLFTSFNSLLLQLTTSKLKTCKD